MSSPEALRPKNGPRLLQRRALLRGFGAAVGAASAAALLTGCSSGLQPMYGTMGGNAGAKLARVSIATIPGRIGQRVRNELRFHTEDRSGLPPKYKLVITLRRRLITTLVKRDGHSSAKVLNLDAKFKLVSLANRAVVLEGSSYARAGLERNTSIYSNVRAIRDAENRTARTIATDLRSRLAAFLATAT